MSSCFCGVYRSGRPRSPPWKFDEHTWAAGDYFQAQFSGACDRLRALRARLHPDDLRACFGSVFDHAQGHGWGRDDRNVAYRVWQVGEARVARQPLDLVLRDGLMGKAVSP